MARIARRKRSTAYMLIGLGLFVMILFAHQHIEIGLAHAMNRLRGGYTVDERLAQFGAAAQDRLLPHFQAVGVAFPGARIALLVFKDQRRLEVYVKAAGGPWRFLRGYPVLAASGGPGPKLREGDGQVPEGQYRVSFFNPNSLFHVSLRLDYPNSFDRAMARADGREQLGGDIMIHGKSVSIGCLAMGDEAIEELFTLAAQVGMARIRVLIAPRDFRRGGPPVDAKEPPWLAELYRQLTQELEAFPPASLPAAADG